MSHNITVGARVLLAPHPSYNVSYRKLAESERIGLVERVFRPIGAREDVVRVVYPKEGRFKERVEFFPPRDLILLASTHSEAEV